MLNKCHLNLNFSPIHLVYGVCQEYFQEPLDTSMWVHAGAQYSPSFLWRLNFATMPVSYQKPIFSVQTCLSVSVCLWISGSMGFVWNVGCWKELRVESNFMGETCRSRDLFIGVKIPFLESGI